jgi:hypothetical protein
VTLIDDTSVSMVVHYPALTTATQSTKNNVGVTTARSFVIRTRAQQWPVPKNNPCTVLHVHPSKAVPASICNHAVLEEAQVQAQALHVLQIRRVLAMDPIIQSTVRSSLLSFVPR